ncbi:MAG: ArsC/Spx/MgsR family protein [Mizugakiibacter sp.]|uniref:ArsC/Spx/MgsR family protein n=1 Tax=Mizugakiibacter sp. TaxID=1972610 RepID=UPI0031BFA455|nr:arsenate reductase [Xanthomonadaceae bacterium]
MAEAAVVYGLDGCDACGKARRWLDRFGPPYRFVDLARERPEPAALKAWAAALGGWGALVDRGGRAWAGLLPQRKHPDSDPEWTLLIREHPGILRHPVAVLADGRVAVGFTGGSYERLFGKARA